MHAPHTICSLKKADAWLLHYYHSHIILGGSEDPKIHVAIVVGMLGFRPSLTLTDIICDVAPLDLQDAPFVSPSQQTMDPPLAPSPCSACLLPCSLHHLQEARIRQAVVPLW
jgi:hypothetical protein